MRDDKAPKTFEEFKRECKTPELLLKFMNSNITYGRGDESSWELNSPKNTFNCGEGQCYDQSWFQLDLFKSMNLKTYLNYVVIFNVDDTSNGVTHMYTVYVNDSKLYYFENSWSDFRGIHGPFKSMTDIDKLMMNKILSVKDWESFNSIYKATINPTKLKSGMSFDDFQEVCQKDLVLKTCKRFRT